MLKAPWNKFFTFNVVFGIVLIFFFGIPRFLLVMDANVREQFNLISIIFVLMCLSPWIFLTREGRQTIGIRKPKHWSWLLPSFLFGMGLCILVYFLGKWLFFESINNWFIYLSRPYEPFRDSTSPNEMIIKFLIFAIIGMTFSPIGEEFLYRGLIHQSFSNRVGDHVASVIDSGAFALTHLAHFGLVFIAGSWQFLWFPAILWVLLMFLAGRLFYYMKVKTGSVFGAVACHAGFNLAMTYLMAYHVMN